MTNKEIFDQVLNKIGLLQEIARRKNWTIVSKPLIDNPASMDEVNKIEKSIGVPLPLDYKELFLFSKHLEFGYQFDETLSDEFRENFSGDIHWNLTTFLEQYKDLQEWIEAQLDPDYNDIDSISTMRQLYANKLPFMTVPNGDMIVIGNIHSEVVYLSHENDSMHGKILGNTLWEFLEFYSRIGFAGNEDWQLQPFFDFENDKMITSGDKITRFIKLLEE